MTPNNNNKNKVITKAEDIVYYTNVNESNYPIFVTNELTISIKKKPEIVKAVFYVKRIEEINEITHESLDMAINAIKEITNAEPRAIEKYRVTYEVYKGEMNEYLGDVDVFVIKVMSKHTPFSGDKWSDNKAFAIAYDWQRRVTAKYPLYVYVEGEKGRKGRAYAWISIKLVTITPEFQRLFDIAVNQTLNQTSNSQQKEDIQKEVIVCTNDVYVKVIQQMIHTIQQIESQLTLVKSELEKLLTQLNTQS